MYAEIAERAAASVEEQGGDVADLIQLLGTLAGSLEADQEEVDRARLEILAWTDQWLAS